MEIYGGCDFGRTEAFDLCDLWLDVLDDRPGRGVHMGVLGENRNWMALAMAAVLN